MPAGSGRHGEESTGVALNLLSCPPGGHAAAGEAASRQSAAERVQGHSGSPREPRTCQGPLGPTPPGSVGTLAVTELSLGPWEQCLYSLKLEV